MEPQTIAYEKGIVRLLDQTRLPLEEKYLDCRSVDELIDAIRRLVVRGAPAIGVAAAYGVVLAVDRGIAAAAGSPRKDLPAAIESLRAARPTAVNLGWALDRMARLLDQGEADGSALRAALLAEAEAIHEEDRDLCRRMGEHGAKLLPDRATVLIPCNTGFLATGGMGTALAVVYTAHAQGKQIRVFADETRPLLQGARLTAWELERAGIEVHLLADGAAGWLLATQKIDAVFIGGDRIAGNGDVANKIGSYPLAVLARRHGVPFYVVAPYSTLDRSLEDGSQIAIELRDPSEVHHALGQRLAPEGVGGYNPAFDVTPAELVSGIITEQGVFRAPYRRAFAAAYGG
jgi:methylthioribose-1-phosphate isomerase